MILWGAHYATTDDFDCFMDDTGVDTIADLAEPRILRNLSRTSI